MTAPHLDTPGLDTALARTLHAAGAVDLGVLQGLLAQSRAGGPTLARTLVARGVLPEPHVLAALQRAGGTEPGASPERRLGDYVLEAPLGQGGMGTVWRARHATTGVAYAVKVLERDAGPDLRLRFEREGAAQARVDEHPNVARVRSAGVAGGTLYLVMDLVEGGSLGDRLRGGPLAPDEAAALCRDLAWGMAHCHAHGVLHRDLKPDNVLLDPAGTPRLVDFGLATLADAGRLTATGDVLGTPAYMAPEQARGVRSEVGPHTDVYGLGAILYHSLTGRPPFGGEGALLAVLAAVCEQPPVSPRTLAPDVPAALEAICLRALAKAPADRYPSAQALGEALERFLSGEPAPGPRRWLVPAARIGALVVCAAAAFALLRPGAAPEDHAQPAPASGGLDPAPGDGRAPSLEAVAGRVTAAALAGDGVAAAAQALLDRLDAAGRELPPGWSRQTADDWRTVAAALAGAGGPARSTVGLIQAQRAEIEACLGRSDLEFQRERINHLQGGDDGALEAGAELAQTTLRELRRIEPGPGEVVRLSVAGTLGRLIVDRSCNGDCNPTAVLEALTALADGETTGAVAATVTVVRKLLDLAGDVPEGAEGLPEPFGFLARVERGVDPEDGWPAPATLGRGGCAYWMRLCIARGGTRVSACVAALERDDAPTAVEAWLAAGRQVARAVPYATFARGAVGAGRVNLEVAQIALLALDVDAAKEALGEQSFAERSTHREALRWDLLQAERLLALGEWGQAEALLQKLCEPGVPYDTAKLADRWAARAFALAALGRPEAAARELKVAASRKKEAWLPWRTVANSEELLGGGEGLQARLRRALNDAGAIAPTPAEEWLARAFDEERGKVVEFARASVDPLDLETVASLGTDLADGGGGAPADPVLARRILLRAALADASRFPDGANRARVRLGKLLADGVGGTADVEAARAWWQRVIDSEHARYALRAEAASAWALRCEDDGEARRLLEATPPNDWTARQRLAEIRLRAGEVEGALRQLAGYVRNQDELNAALYLIWLHTAGELGVPRDDDEALGWVEAAAGLVAAEERPSRRADALRRLRGTVRALDGELRTRADALLQRLPDR